MIRTFVPSIIIVSLLSSLASADIPKRKTQTEAAPALQVLYRPGIDKFTVTHPVYRPGIDKFEIIHPVYRPGIDKFRIIHPVYRPVEVRILSGKSVPASPVISKQTTITPTSNISESITRLWDSVTSQVPIRGKGGIPDVQAKESIPCCTTTSHRSAGADTLHIFKPARIRQGGTQVPRLE